MLYNFLLTKEMLIRMYISIIIIENSMLLKNIISISYIYVNIF